MLDITWISQVFTVEEPSCETWFLKVMSLTGYNKVWIMIQVHKTKNAVDIL